MILADNGIALVHLGRQRPHATTTTTCTSSARLKGSDFEVVDTSRPAQRLRPCPPNGGHRRPPVRRTMRAWATSRSLPAAVAFPVVFCLTFFLCVGLAPRARADARGRPPARRRRDLARHGRRARHLRRVLPRPSGRRARGLVARARRGCSPSLAGALFGPGATASSARVYEALEQPPRSPAPEPPREPPGSAAASRTNGPPTMAAKSAPRPTTEITPSASSAVRSNAPGWQAARSPCRVPVTSSSEKRANAARCCVACTPRRTLSSAALRIREAALERRALPRA